MEKNNIEDRINQKTPNNPFSVPEDYFQTLESRMMEKITEEKQPRRTSWLQIARPYFGLTAFFAVAIIVVQFVFPRFIDDSRMLQKGEVAAVQEQAAETWEIELDPDFNPTREEIIEYLAQEGDLPDLLLLSMRQ